MNKGINLAIKRVDPQEAKAQKQNKRLRFFGYTFLTVFTLASIILFILLQASPISSLREEQEQLSAALNTQNQKIQNEILINNQLDYVGEILGSRSDLSDIMSVILSVLPPTISISSYQSANGIIEMTLQSSSLIDLENFFDQITALSQAGDVYKKIIVSNISVSPSGSYTFTITFRQ